MLLTGTLKTAWAQQCLNNLGQNMEYVVQAFKVLKNLVHAEANARAKKKTGFFVAFLTQTRFLCVITN